MKAILEQLHHELLADLKRNWELELPETERVECCYHVAMNYWIKVKEVFFARADYSEEEEIAFFKEVKPLFTSHIEYYLILNQALLFVPGEFEVVISYWEDQLNRYDRYCKKNAAFIKYFESDSSEYDAEYFTIRNNRLEMPPQERIYEDEDCRSTHDHIVRGLMANSMYCEYCKMKIEDVGVKKVASASPSLRSGSQ